MEVAAFRSLLVAKNILVQEDDKWDQELEHFVAESYRRIFDLGAKSAVESTNRVRQLEDTVDERERRIAQLEREVTALHKELRAYKKGAR